MENITALEKNKLAAKYGFVVGVIYIVITSAVNLAIANMIYFYLCKTIGYVCLFVIVGYFASQIKKSNGGYIEFKEIFGAIFIMLIISGFMSYVYNYLYMFVIDPHFMEKIKTATINFMEKSQVPSEKIEDTISKFDKQIEESKHFNLTRNLLTLSGAFIVDSLFGLFVAAIVKKSRPLF